MADGHEPNTPALGFAFLWSVSRLSAVLPSPCSRKSSAAGSESSRTRIPRRCASLLLHLLHSGKPLSSDVWLYVPLCGLRRVDASLLVRFGHSPEARRGSAGSYRDGF